MAQQIGSLLTLAKPAAPSQTDSWQRSERSAIVDLMGRDLTLAEAIKLRDLALSEPHEREPQATPEQIARHLQFIAATLPSKNTDDETGKQRFAVYVRMLAGYSNEAMSFMSQEVLRNCDWFPTPRQCLDALARYSAPPSLTERALALASSVINTSFKAWRAELESSDVEQARIDAAPDKWKRIAFEQGLLRFTPDNGYTQRKAA